MFVQMLDQTIWCLKVFALVAVFLLTLVLVIPLWICSLVTFSAEPLGLLSGLFELLAKLKRDVRGDEDLTE